MKALRFNLKSTNGRNYSLTNCWVNMWLSIYPKDDTPGCTTETKDFNKPFQNSKNSIVKYMEFLR